MSKLDSLAENLKRVLVDHQIILLSKALGEITLTLHPRDLVPLAKTLRDHADLRFEILVDLCGMDYLSYGGGDGQLNCPRFAVVYHLLSITHNQRIRVKVYATEESFPVLASVVEIWPSANWYEREAFDLFGIMFAGHPDLRRILTDYGFIGHPFRKDFPVSGYVEMRYDPEQARVVYQPITIEPREVVPRILREEGYATHE